MKLLMIAMDDGRWGQARLVQPLREAGFEVAALCPGTIPLAHSSLLARHFKLGSQHSSRRMERDLAASIHHWQPWLIIPGDERSVACLQHILRRAEASRRPVLAPAGLRVLRNSLGKPEQFNAKLLKSDTIALARRLGVPVLHSITARSAEDAQAAATRLGYPVLLKRSFSWAGQGVTPCPDEAALRQAAPRIFTGGPSICRKIAKHLLNRSWYPNSSAVDVQATVEGRPAFWCGVAINGRVICGFTGLVQQASSATGPSSVVRIAPHAEMQNAALLMTKAFGLTGFVSFDFMLEHGTGRALLLECNPRPVPSCHLGARIGADLCQALAAELHGEAAAHETASSEELVALFPQEWQRDPQALAAFTGHVDIPVGDAGLMRLISEMHPGSGALMPITPDAAQPSPGNSPNRPAAALRAQLSRLCSPRSQASFLR